MPYSIRAIEPTVSASYANELIYFAVANGAHEGRLLEMAGIEPSDLQDPDNRLAFACYKRLMKAGQTLCNDPAFALSLGAGTDFEKISVVGLMCYNAATMGEALAMLNRYGYLVAELNVPSPNERFQLVREGGELWLIDTRVAPNDFPELTEETWARFITSNARNFSGIPFVKAVYMPHSKPEHSEAYARILNIPVFFESDRNALLLHENWPEIKLPFANQYVMGLLNARADTLLKSLKNSKSIRGQVESLLIPNLHQGKLSMTYVAKQMGCSRQTLYRRLKQEGVGYDIVLDDLRHKMAIDYLRAKKVSIYETAYLVGFSDPSAFSRAFKRWTGHSPGKIEF